MNNVLETIRNRRSTRSFTQIQIGKDKLEAIIEAGLYAPSGLNMQSWNFTVIQDAELISELNGETKLSARDFPNEMIRKIANNDKHNIFYEALTIVIVSGKDDAPSTQSDCSAAIQNMLIAAESLDVGACWTGFISFLFMSEKKDLYMNKLNIPEGFTPLHAVSLGYKSTDKQVAPKRRENTVQYL